MVEGDETPSEVDFSTKGHAAKGGLCRSTGRGVTTPHHATWAGQESFGLKGGYADFETFAQVNREFSTFGNRILCPEIVQAEEGRQG